MNLCVEKVEIRKGIAEIFRNRLEMDIESYEEDSLDKNLFGDQFMLKPRDLLCIFVDVEREFGISIPENVVLEGKFNTINNIADIVSSLIHPRE